jgi:hypothetical protein
MAEDGRTGGDLSLASTRPRGEYRGDCLGPPRGDMAVGLCRGDSEPAAPLILAVGLLLLSTCEEDASSILGGDPCALEGDIGPLDGDNGPLDGERGDPPPAPPPHLLPLTGDNEPSASTLPRTSKIWRRGGRGGGGGGGGARLTFRSLQRNDAQRSPAWSTLLLRMTVVPSHCRPSRHLLGPLVVLNLDLAPRVNSWNPRL